MTKLLLILDYNQKRTIVKKNDISVASNTQYHSSFIIHQSSVRDAGCGIQIQDSRFKIRGSRYGVRDAGFKFKTHDTAAGRNQILAGRQ